MRSACQRRPYLGCSLTGNTGTGRGFNYIVMEIFQIWKVETRPCKGLSPGEREPR